MCNKTWSFGNQRGLGSNLPDNVGNADCGQHAAGNVSGGYRVGSIDIANQNNDQTPDFITPSQFIPAHGMSEAIFRTSPIPGRAEAAAYLRIQDQAFHYAKIVNGQFIQTDANRAEKPGMGGVISHFKLTSGQLDLIGQKAVQPTDSLNLGQFVDYCINTYGNGNCLFYYCKFG